MEPRRAHAAPVRIRLEHTVAVADPSTHLLELDTRIVSEGGEPLPSPLTLFMPVWTPGSYLVREFARHVEGMTAEADGRAVPATKVRKNAWAITCPGASSVRVRYRVYANELTVRTSHVDATHAFVNGAATFLAVEDAEDAPSTVELRAPAGWRASTALPVVRENVFAAANLDELIDAPIEVGTHSEDAFDVLGKPHRFAIWPGNAVAPKDRERLTEDTRTILRAEASLFGDALPYENFLFFLHLSPRSRGGLEHASCASLVASPSSFSSRDAYLDLLSLIAHEAFHVWNVKRIKPAGITPYRYEKESYTRQLWWFEGATSYYDWLMLRRSALCSIGEYLEHLGGEIAYLESQPGRLVQSLEDSSFDAWIKAYRPDENTLNSAVSYYRKGEIVCAMLDLEMRARTGWRVGLDAVMTYLWNHFGARDLAVPEGALQGIFEQVCDVPLGDLFDAWVRQPGEVDCARVLATVGLEIERAARAGTTASLGARVRGDGGRTLVSHIIRGSAAQRAGIDPGDEILAIAGKRTDTGSVDSALAGRTPGEVVEVLLARDGRTLTCAATLDEMRYDRVRLVPRTDATTLERERFALWLGDVPLPMEGARS